MPVFGRRRSAGDRDAVGESAADLAAEAAADETPGAAPGAGPWDVAEPHPELQRVDLGSLQVPVLEGTDIQLVFAEQHGAWVTVRHELSELQLQAFAAPKRDSLWDDVRAEIAAEISGAGGRSRSAPGRSAPSCRPACPPAGPAAGRHAAGQVHRRGRAALVPARGVQRGGGGEPAAAAPLEAVMREVVVVRGEHPVPPRDLLELRLPPEAAAALEEQAKAQQEQEEQNRFATQPSPFERGPEITETR